MAEPSEKSAQTEAFSQKLFGFDRRDTIKVDVCLPAPIGCDGPATEFTDERSRREFSISGLCQTCQDEVF